ncbi:MAG: hypothetical protein ACRDRS_17770 [Pseudonocardiaceae bacterium]
MGLVRRPVVAIRGGAARKRLAAALLGPLTTVALLAATCGKNGESVDTVAPAGSIAPLGPIVPLNGGSSLPDPALVLLSHASQDLRTGNFDAAAQAAQQARQEAPQAVGGATRCIADAVEGVADVNRNNIGPGLQSLQRGECAIKVVPDDVRMELATLIYRAQIVGYARAGDDAAAESSLHNALMVAPGRADLFVTELCQAARKPSAIAQCATPPVTTTPPKPTSTAPMTRKPAPTRKPPATTEPPTTTEPLATTEPPTTTEPPATTVPRRTSEPTKPSGPLGSTEPPTTSESPTVAPSR